MTTSVGNNSVFKGFFEKQKISGPNFIDWYRQLRLVLSTEDKENYLEHPIPTAPVVLPRQQVHLEALAAHAAWVKGQKEFDTVREFHTCKQEEGQSVSSHVLKMKGYIDNLERLGQPVRQNLAVSLILVSLNKDFDSFVQNYNTHGMGKTMNEPHAMLKLHKETLPNKDANLALHAIRVGRVLKNQKINRRKLLRGVMGLRGSKKLKLSDLSLYVGDGHHVAVKAIETYHLELPSGLVIVLNNCHYAPSITRGVISVSRLFDDGFINRFDDNNVISVSKNNLVYFMVVPRYGIFEIDMSCSNINDSSIKKRIEKLQHDGLLNSIDIESLGKCVSCMFGKMEHGIISHHTPPYTSQNNRVSERRNQSLLDMVRSMMSQTTLPKSFWDYALMVPTKKRDTLTKPDKLDPRSFKCIFIGYPKETMGYSFYSPSENKLFIARNAEFFDSKLLDLKASGSVEDLELIQEEDTNPSVDTSLNYEEDDQEIDEPQSDINPIRRSTRTRCPTDRLCLYIDAEEHKLGDLGEPTNYKAALLDLESKKWLDAMNVEIQSMKDNYVWVLVELPPNARTVGSKWLFKKKTNMDDIRAIRILIAIAAYYDYEIWQMDAKTAFLNGHLPKKTIPMQEKLKLSKSQGASTPVEKQRMQNISYPSAIGSIMYAVRSNRPDVAFAQNMTSRFQQNPGKEHWTAVKNILNYLVTKMLNPNTQGRDAGLTLPGVDVDEYQVGYDSALELIEHLRAMGETNAFVNQVKVSIYLLCGYFFPIRWYHPYNISSTSGWIFLLGGGAISWASKKPTCITSSTMESEFVALAAAGNEAEWLRNLIYEIPLWPKQIPPFLSDVIVPLPWLRLIVKCTMASLDT
nr:hypothetical protein [Tanacetum cinerariifolium]